MSAKLGRRSASRDHLWAIAIEHGEVLWRNHADDGINRSPPNARLMR